MNMPELDYRFAWRWLLPLMDGDKVLLQGFSEEEQIFWKGVLRLGNESLTADAAQATVWVVSDASPSSTSPVTNFPQIRSLSVVGSSAVVCAWRRWLAGSFSDVKEYSLIPALSPRLVVPLDKAKWIVEALLLHRPGRIIPRLGVAVVRMLAVLGVKLAPLRMRMVFLASKHHGVPSQGARHARLDMNGSGSPESFALYLGSLGTDRKTVILPLGGMRGTILKHGVGYEAQAALQNEASALKAMSQTLLAMHVPELFDVTIASGQTTLHQEYRQRKWMTDSRLKDFAARFLAKLSGVGLRPRPLEELLKESKLMTSSEARALGQTAYAQVREFLDRQVASRATIWGHRSHGDFAPWNCSWTTKGFFVFDWEQSLSWDVALGDAFYFILGPIVSADRSPKLAVVESDALALAATVVGSADLDIEDIRVYWVLWLLRRMKQKPSVLYERLLERF